MGICCMAQETQTGPLYQPIGVGMGGRFKREGHPTPVLLPGESQGQRSLVGCRPWGHTEPDMTKVT